MAMPWSSELTEIGLSLTPHRILFGTICTFVMGYAIQRAEQNWPTVKDEAQ